MRQKAKLESIKAGDKNTTLFHQSIKARRVQNHVYGINDSHGCWQDTQSGVQDAFLSYYQQLLGTNHAHMKPVIQQIVQRGPVIIEAHKRIFAEPFTTDEIKCALFSIPGQKASGLRFWILFL